MKFEKPFQDASCRLARGIGLGESVTYLQDQRNWIPMAKSTASQINRVKNAGSSRISIDRSEIEAANALSGIAQVSRAIPPRRCRCD
jgi:hypothetical protein